MQLTAQTQDWLDELNVCDPMYGSDVELDDLAHRAPIPDLRDWLLAHISKRRPWHTAMILHNDELDAAR